LKIYGFEARAVKGGEEALEAVRREAPQAIVLDLMMPHMNGFTVLAHLQRETASRHIPIIVLSALIDQAPHVERLPGVSGVMCKGDFSMDGFRKLLVKAGLLS
jgi:CheY-like chemotaxis protein